jgi:hypothetical protein
MSQCPQLPFWLSYLQATALPLITALGAWIAFQQMQIARQQKQIANDKLEHDVFYRLYDKRVAVYEATRKFLQDIFEDDFSEEKVRVYGLSALDAKFLFDDALHNYLIELRNRVAAWNQANNSIATSSSQEEKTAFEKIKSEQLTWIIGQGDEVTGFAPRFIPYLVHRGKTSIN